METLVEEIIDNAIFKKESLFTKLLKKFKCRSSCFCSIESDDLIEKKKKQKEELLNFLKILKKNSILLESQI
jgi:hypothetical protein